MLRQNQLYIHTAGMLRFVAVCIYNHALLYCCVAGSHKCLLSFNFYYADTACSDLIDFFQITQCRNLDSGLSGSCQNRSTFRYLNFFIIDR